MPISATERQRLNQRLPAQLHEATVLDPATDEDGWLRVEVDGELGVVQTCPWMPRLDVPVSPGDAAAVIESDGGNYWAVQWWPQGAAVPTPIVSGARWYTGADAPLDSLGVDNDFYLQASGDYFEKVGGTWVHQGTLAPGAGTGDLHYTHIQSSPSATWTVAHGLGKVPSIVVVDSAGTVLHVGESVVDLNTTTLTFVGATTGTAYCN
jgi:hypothetical protein